MIADLTGMRWTIILAAGLGFFIAPIGRSGWDIAMSQYDAARPVVKIDAELLGRDGNAATVRLTGTKLRSCTFVRLHAYSVSEDGEMTSVYIKRNDRIENGQTRPLGRHDFGEWMIWPVEGESKAVIYSQHDCDGRLVQTRVASIDIK